MKESMSAADSLYNLQFIREFCDSCLKSCCHLALEDMLYTPQELQVPDHNSTDTITNILNTVFLMPDSFCVICSAQLAKLLSRAAELV